MSKKAKVTAFVRADSTEALQSFDRNFPETQWFVIPNGADIRPIDRELYLDICRPEFDTGKHIVIGFTPQIAIAGLIGKSDFVVFSQLLKKDIVEVSQFKLRW